MKFIHYVGMFCLLMSCSQTFAKTDRTISCDHVITAKDIGRNGFTIKCPGVWCLAEDVVYNPCDGNPAIRIAASNVTLDLKNRTLSQNNKNVLNIDGIDVDCGLSNIAIKNGTVRDFSRAGIFVCPTAATELDLEASKASSKMLRFNRVGKRSLPIDTPITTAKDTLIAPVQTIDISKIRALNNGLQNTLAAGVNGMGGVVIFSAQDILVEHCNLQQNALSGLIAYDVIKFTMDNCHCDDNISSFFFDDNTFNYSAGLTISPRNIKASDIAIRNSTFNRNVSQGIASGIFIAALFGGGLVINNVSIDAVQTNDTAVVIASPTNSQNLSIGIEATQCHNVSLNNVQASGCSIQVLANVPANAESTVTGIALGGSDFKVTNVSVTGNTNTTTTEQPNIGTIRNFGIDIFANRVSLDNCYIATNTNVVTSSQSLQNLNLGINIDPTTVDPIFDFSVTNCQIINLSNTYKLGTPAFQIAQGIATSNAFNGVIRNCQMSAFTNSSTNASIPVSPFLAEGIDISQSGDITVEDCVSSGNIQSAVNPVNQFSIAAGFKASLSSRVIFRRCVASNNKTTNSAAPNAGLAFGFSTTEPIAPGPLSDQVVFDSCIAEGNTGADNASGGFDIRGVTRSKVLNCIADGNVIGILVSENPTNTPACMPPNPACPPSSKNLFSGNTLLGNTQYGINDTTANNSNAYYSNRADSNGTPSALSANYVGNPFPLTTACVQPPACTFPGDNLTPVRNWLLPNAPCPFNTNCAPADPLDNISIA